MFLTGMDGNLPFFPPHSQGVMREQVMSIAKQVRSKEGMKGRNAGREQIGQVGNR